MNGKQQSPKELKAEGVLIATQKQRFLTIIEQINNLFNTCNPKFLKRYGSDQLIGLRDNTQYLLDYISKHDGLRISDIAWTLQLRVYLDQDNFVLKAQSCEVGLTFGSEFGSRSGTVAAYLHPTSCDKFNETKYTRALLLNAAMHRATSFRDKQRFTVAFKYKK